MRECEGLSESQKEIRLRIYPQQNWELFKLAATGPVLSVVSEMGFCVNGMPLPFSHPLTDAMSRKNVSKLEKSSHWSNNLWRSSFSVRGLRSWTLLTDAPSTDIKTGMITEKRSTKLLLYFSRDASESIFKLLVFYGGKPPNFKTKRYLCP